MLYFVVEHNPKVGITKGYYVGWNRSLREPFQCENARLGAKTFSKRSADKMVEKLSNPSYWGGTWVVEPVPDGFSYVPGAKPIGRKP